MIFAYSQYSGYHPASSQSNNAGNAATLTNQHVAQGNNPVGNKTNLGLGQRTEQFVRVRLSIVMEVTLVNADTDGFVSIEGSGWVIQVLKEWICCGRRTIGKASVEVGQMTGTWYLLPLGNHCPDLTACSLWCIHQARPIPTRVVSRVGGKSENRDGILIGPDRRHLILCF